MNEKLFKNTILHFRFINLGIGYLRVVINYYINNFIRDKNSLIEILFFCFNIRKKIYKNKYSYMNFNFKNEQINYLEHIFEYFLQTRKKYSEGKLIFCMDMLDRIKYLDKLNRRG